MRVIAGKYKGAGLKRPPETITRPTTDRIREAIFNVLCHTPDFSFHDAKVLDVFAGSGALGVEALSRGAEKVFFVEKHPQALQVIRENIIKLRIESQCQLLAIDVQRLPKALVPMDMVFMDPPYHKGLELSTLEILRSLGWVNSATWIILEADKETKIMFEEKKFLIKTLRNYGRTSIYIVMSEK